jgi:uncharacterized membrane protein YedE/YeeE
MVPRRPPGHDEFMNDTLVKLAAGALFGTGAGLLLIANGRIAGISGIAAGALRPRRGDFAWRALFVLGLLVGGSVALAGGDRDLHCGGRHHADHLAAAGRGHMTRDHLPIAALSGFLLAIALSFGQLTRPEIITGWVDVRAWNPHMLVFFAAAAAVYHLFARVHTWRQRRAGVPEVCAPVPNLRIDARLLVGSSIFGIGWAIGGACPGPALTTLGAGAPWAAVFVGAMALGLAVVRSRA